ncbi:hypothetical protein Hanom_Chr04g00335511 [Helianthus anomalus]
MDGDKSMADLEHNSPGMCEDRFSEGGGDLECNPEDEAEDGEIRSPVNNRPASGPGYRSSSVPLMDTGIEKSLEVEKMEPEKPVHEVHGEPISPKESNYAIGGPDVIVTEKSASETHDQAVNGIGLVNQLMNDGPTPIIGLGKRSRDDRSPPSTGSMQGPPIRGFSHNRYPLTLTDLRQSIRLLVELLPVEIIHPNRR